MGADAAGDALRAMPPDVDAHEAMRDAIRQARAAVAAISWAPVRGNAAPSSTIVAASCAGTDITVGWLGDSRAYWIDAVDAQRLTDDDSWIEEMVASGALEPAQAALDPRAHVITAWLGADAPDRDARVVSFRAPRRGRLVLCSDGLWNTLPEADALGDAVRTVRPTGSALDLARSLTHHALAAGGHDNITVAVVDIDPTTAELEETS
jgi:serine/threonine protein phosphatase PrpC